MVLTAFGSMAPAQSWSEPFNHNDYYNATTATRIRNRRGRHRATTHHSDMHQRYFELVGEVANGTVVTFATPEREAAAPPGLYMLWLVTNTGAVSNAKWVMLP